MTCSFDPWLRLFLEHGAGNYPLAALAVVLLWFGNRSQRREYFNDRHWLVAVQGNLAALICFAGALAIIVRLVLWGVQ